MAATYPPHLTTGSQQPPKIDGTIRLYSMNFCPYAQRTRLILKLKNVPHDIVNINLVAKPEWYSQIHPDGKVPALDVGDRVIVESLDICDYLDETYPEPALYPSDPEAKEKDKELIQKIGPLTGVFARSCFRIEKKTPEQWVAEFEPHLDRFEEELEKRGAPYFGGDSPGMVDFMLWPWGERAGALALSLGQRLPFKDGQFPKLKQWRKTMRQHPVCDEIYNGPEKFWKVVGSTLDKEPPPYDAVHQENPVCGIRRK